jgi:hypothetical protein
VETVGRGWEHGEMAFPRGGSPRTLEERFWEKVDKTETCWLWLGAIDKKSGYGVFNVQGGRTKKVHRLAYELMIGAPPQGMSLDHLCRVRHCVNPEHLEPVTQRENVMRGEGFSAVNAIKTHCPSGHAYAEHGALTTQGYRRCNACARERMAARAAARTPAEHRAYLDHHALVRKKRLAG